MGQKILYFETIDSTQKEIFRRIDKQDIENGTIVLANKQTNGIGTHGRKWNTSDEGNIAFSLYIKTDCMINKIEGITLDIAKILLHIFKNFYDVNLKIKIPNDLVFNNKKICGILTESKSYLNKIKYLVIGIGINTNKTPSTLELSKIASSIKQEFNIDVDNNKVIAEFCNLFEKELINRGIM